jgi:hypothetical protein
MDAEERARLNAEFWGQIGDLRAKDSFRGFKAELTQRHGQGESIDKLREFCMGYAHDIAASTVAQYSFVDRTEFIERIRKIVDETLAELPP